MTTSRSKYLQKNYGISEEDYLHLAQLAGEHRCWGCGVQPKAGKNHHVDHNHSTKNVRAILCWQCNRILAARGKKVTAEQLRHLAWVLEHGEQTVRAVIGHNGKGK